MAIDSEEALASLKTLACVAMADGHLHDSERLALERVLEEAQLTEVTVDSLIADRGDLGEQLQRIHSATARELAYNTAFLIANIDGDCSPAEAEMLERIRTTLGLSDRNTKRLAKLVSRTHEGLHPADAHAIAEPEARAAAIDKLTLDYATLCAYVAAFPAMGAHVASDISVLVYQCRLVRDIGVSWGADPSPSVVRAILGSFFDGQSSSRPPSLNTLLKLTPIGSSVGKVHDAFVTAWAIGLVANRYFADETFRDTAALRAAFTEAIAAGEAAYKQHADYVRDKLRG